MSIRYYDEKWTGEGYGIDKKSVAKIFQHYSPIYSGWHLDIGCGDGSLIAYIHEANLVGGVTSVGVDFSLSGIRRSSQHLSLCLADACLLPFQDETFDLITCKEAIEHIPDHKLALKEIARVCKRQGQIIIVVPNFTRLGNRLLMVLGHYPDAEEHLHGFDFSRLKDDLESSGLKVSEIFGDFVSIPYTRFSHLPLARLFPGLSSHIIAVCRR